MATKKCAEKKYFLLQFNSNDVGGQLSNFEYSHSVRIVNKSSHGISSSNRRWNGKKWIEFVLHSTAYFHLISFFCGHRLTKYNAQVITEQNLLRGRTDNSNIIKIVNLQCLRAMIRAHVMQFLRIKSSAQDIHLGTECKQMYECQWLWLPQKHVRSHTK